MEIDEELDPRALDIDQGPVPSAVLSRRAVVVVGCHRSGTSALARVLSLVGCDLPKHVMPPLDGSNELGFWEPEAVVVAHEAFLGNIGSSWDDEGPLPDGALVSAAARELRQELGLLLREEYGTSPLFVVKDPRISRLLPLWYAVLAELHVAPATAIAVRNPLEVAASLKMRDGFTTTKSLLLWLRHALDAEQHSRDRLRSIVMYDELVRDWQGVLSKLGAELDIRWPLNTHRASVEVETFLSEQHRHHVFGWHDLEGRADVVSWVKETYFALRSSNPAPVLEQIRDDLLRADAAFGPIIEEARRAARMSGEQLLEATAARDMLAADLEARSAALEARSAEVQQLHEDAAGLTNAVAASDERAAEHREEVDRVRAVRDAFASEVEVLAAEVERLSVVVKVAQSHAAAVEREVESAREELRDAHAKVERLIMQANESASRIAQLEAGITAERATLLTALDGSRGEIGELKQDAAAANARFAALEAQAATERGTLLEQLDAARADVERLTARVFAAESEAATDRRTMLSELAAASAEALLRAEQLEGMSRDAEELASAADELLSAAVAEIEASRADRDRLQAEVVDALEEHGQLLLLVEHLEAALESASSALSDQFEAERSELLTDLGAARTEVALVRSEFEQLKSDAASKRAKVIAERDARRTEVARLVAELEAARTHAERLATGTAELEAALDEQRALLHALRSVTKRRNPRRRSLSQFGTWLLPPTPRKLNYLGRYMSLRWSGDFDVDSYLAANPDVLAAGLNPLMHYVQYGHAEGRGSFRLVKELAGADPSPEDAAPNPVAPADQAVRAGGDEGAPLAAAGEVTSEAGAERGAFSTDLTDDLRAKLEGDFDSDFYRGSYDDIERSGMDPLEHYFFTGWREGRDPSSEFSTTYYLSSNAEVAAEEINPLVHYVMIGRGEGRHPYPPTGFRRQTLQTLQSIDDEISGWQQPTYAIEARLDGPSLTAALAARIGTRKHVVISCSHDNYTQVVGGAQLCVALEQEAFVEEGCAYVNLHPAQPLPVLSRETQAEALDLYVLCDGESIGPAPASTIIAALASVRSDQGVDFGLVVHALHGHSPEVLVQLHRALVPRWEWLWLHDYFGICPNSQLLRNRIEPCGAPPPESAGCAICIFGQERLDHLPRFRRLLDSVPFDLVAPSQFMADRWKAYFGDEQLEITVHENGRLSRTPSEIGDLLAPASGPARLAFLGTPAIHKGWGVFLELAQRGSDPAACRFYHFGDGRYRAPNVVTRVVNVVEDGPLAMVEALRRDSIDLALVWSLWEESFSYTAHEALAAGVAILTNTGSGNIARVVATPDDGLVFGDESELYAAFDDGVIPDLVDARRKDRGRTVLHLSHSRMTADLVTFDD